MHGSSQTFVVEADWGSVPLVVSLEKELLITGQALPGKDLRSPLCPIKGAVQVSSNQHPFRLGCILGRTLDPSE